MKRLLTSILTVILLFGFGAGLVPTQAVNAAQSAICGESLTWTLTDGTLTISGSGEMEDYTVLTPPSGDMRYYYVTSTAPWYPEREAIRTVKIENGVTGIGNNAFAGCRNLRRVTLPNSVRRIGKYAFADCGSLVEAAIPDGVTCLAYCMFFRCEKLAHVTVPNSVTRIGDSAFGYCCSLSGLVIPDSVTEIGEQAFNRVGNVIYNGSASGCPWGGNVNKVTQGPYVFDSAAKKTLLWCSKEVRGNVTIPDGVTEIGGYAFYICEKITSVTFPDSVTTIGDVAFADCPALARATFGSGLRHIGCCAFSDCTSLERITIPDGVTRIEADAFHGCGSLSDVTLGSGLTEIETGLFNACTALTNITIPDSVTEIGCYAFYECSALRNVYYGGSETQWNKITIYDHNDALENAAVTYNYRTTMPAVLREALQELWTWVLWLIGLIPGLRLPL